MSTLSNLKSIRWDSATASFYVVRRKIINRKGNYNVKEVNVEIELRKKLRDNIVNQINNATGTQEYDYNTVDNDEDFINIDSEETEFSNISDKIYDGPEMVTDYNEIIGTWIYITRLKQDDDDLLAVKRVSDVWTTKKVRSWSSLIFKDNKLIDLDKKEIFRIYLNSDFFCFKDELFIANKKNFETSLNFREGMIRNRDAILSDFEEKQIIHDVDNFKVLIGDNTRRLRKISQIKKSGYYLDNNYLENLKKINDNESWGLLFDEKGHLIVNEDNIELVLKVLNNDRLTSRINNQNFDVDNKQLVTD